LRKHECTLAFKLRVHHLFDALGFSALGTHDLYSNDVPVWEVRQPYHASGNRQQQKHRKRARSSAAAAFAAF
jgi:hypothetical protein